MALRFWPRSLLWRTFILLAALVLATTAAWFGIFRAYEVEPRARQISQNLVSIVNITRTALITSHPERRHELVGAERLRDVVVGAHLEADDALGLFRPGGEHDDRDRGGLLVRANGTADFQAVDLRQHQVQDHQIGRSFSDRDKGVASGRDEIHGEAGLLEIAADELGDIAVVFDDEDAGQEATLL